MASKKSTDEGTPSFMGPQRERDTNRNIKQLLITSSSSHFGRFSFCSLRDSFQELQNDDVFVILSCPEREGHDFHFPGAIT